MGAIRNRLSVGGGWRKDLFEPGGKYFLHYSTGLNISLLRITLGLEESEAIMYL